MKTKNKTANRTSPYNSTKALQKHIKPIKQKTPKDF